MTDAEDIVLTGTNGMGKTNFLEAVYTLCYGNSFKTSSLKDCVKHGEQGFRLEAVFENEFGEDTHIRFCFEQGKRRIEVDGKEVRDRKELIYQFPCIVFCHDDIDFVRGEPEMRRKFFDQTMSLSSPLYFDDMRMYRNILSKRNAAIKLGEESLLPIYDRKLASIGLEIMNERKKAVRDFNEIFPDLFAAVSGGKDDLEIAYQPSWNVSSVEGIERILQDTRERDFKMMTTTSGVHRDRFVVKDSNGVFSQTGSTGQLRLCSLIFRVSEARSFTALTGKKPIVLIDDVLLELDDRKRSLFLEMLDSYSQAFFTFLPNETYFAESHRAPLCYTVEDGTYTPGR